MTTHPTAPQLDTQLTGILTRVEHLRTLNLTAEIGLEQALDETRRTLGALAQYRHGLKRALQAAAVLLVFLLGARAHPAQAQVGQSAVVFLKIEPDSRAAGMGNASVALAEGASATFWNPAGLAF